MSGIFPHRQAVISGVVPLASGAFGSVSRSIGFDAVVESPSAAASGRFCENRAGEIIEIRAMIEIERCSCMGSDFGIQEDTTFLRIMIL
jgi:hypothetical protein